VATTLFLCKLGLTFRRTPETQLLIKKNADSRTEKIMFPLLIRDPILHPVYGIGNKVRWGYEVGCKSC